MNLDASNMPYMKVPREPIRGSNLQNLMFDRILCDVPCSGDGTIRKNVAIWKHWTPLDGNGLHSCVRDDEASFILRTDIPYRLQLRILKRAMRMLAKGGRIVYSTCSLNPVEDEAVIAAALNDIPGAMRRDIYTESTVNFCLRFYSHRRIVPISSTYSKARDGVLETPR